jgi:glycosyltransferase involved in cell wall biosynthesis
MASGRYVGFIDADGDIDPAIMPTFLTLVHEYQPDIVLGSKRHPLSEVVYPPMRRLYSFGYQQLNRLLFRLNVRDTQTGVKLVRREVLADVLPLMIEKRFAFDLELFVVARHLGYTRFFEAPVRLGERFTSTISLKAVKGMLLDTLGIYYRLHITRFYDMPYGSRPAHSTPSAPPANGNGAAPESDPLRSDRKLHL